MQKSCFRDNGTVLRVFEQVSRDGRKTRPLKHRKAEEYRDIPVPAYLWEMVKHLPEITFSRWTGSSLSIVVTAIRLI